MKNSTTTAVILKALDRQLKSLLVKDLKNFKSAQSKTNTQPTKQLMAA